MSLDLNQKCIDRLVEKIIEVLPEIMVKNNMIIISSSTYKIFSAEIILPQKGKLKIDLENYIGAAPFSDFVYEYISKQLSDSQKFDPDAIPLKLIELESYSNPEKIAQQIVEEFNSLPWEYTVSFKIDNEFGKIFNEKIKNYKLSESVDINSPDDEFINQYPLKDKNEKVVETLESSTGILSMLLPVKVEWDKNSTYINFRISGFIHQYGTTATYENALLLLKAFIGLGLSLGMFKIKYKYHAMPYKMMVLVNRKADTKLFLEHTFELDNEISETINDLTTYDLDGTNEDREKKLKWILFALNDIKYVYSNPEKAKRVILASQWFFESYLSKNELLSFIQLTITLEILLGDKAVSDLIGLGELLGNRCAYLIGTSSSEREKILKDFKEIYRIRSKIVHSGERKLHFKERGLYHLVQWMCRRVIQEEIRLMKKDE